MKKMKLIIGLLVAIVLMPGLVKAESNHYNMNANTNTYANTNVTVGNVAGSNTNTNTNTNVSTPIYSVDIEWSGLSFDWVYNSSSSQYEWLNATETCDAVSISNNTVISSNSTYYRNNTCTNLVTGSVLTSGTYYVRNSQGAHEIYVFDNSKDGYVIPRMSWNTATKYNYTTMTVTYDIDNSSCTAISQSLFNSLKNDGITTVFADASCTSTVNIANASYSTNSYYAFNTSGGYNTPSVYEGGSSFSNKAFSKARIYAAGAQYGSWIIPDFNEGAYYHFRLELGIDRSKTINTPVKGETIGSLTIMLTPRTN